MPATLQKEKSKQFFSRELDNAKSESDNTETKVIDLVAVLQESLAKAQAKPVQKKLITQSTVKELAHELAALLGTETPRTATAFLVKVIFDGKRIRFKRADEKLFDLTRAGAELLEKAKIAEGGAWTGGELETRFDLNPATLHRRRKEHRMLYWRDSKHNFHYPKWQFTESGALIDGVQEILELFNSSDEWRIMRYFLSPRHELGGRAPLKLLRAGEKNDVIAHARAHAEENTW